MTSKPVLRAAMAATCIAAALVSLNRHVEAQLSPPEMVDPDLGVRTAVAGLTTPIGIAFLNDRNRGPGLRWPRGDENSTIASC